VATSHLALYFAVGGTEDTPAAPSCNGDGICDAAAGEDATTCPADCTNVELPDLAAVFAEYADLQPQALPAPLPDVTLPVLALRGNFTTFATSSQGVAVAFDAHAVDDTDGPVPVVCAPAEGSVLPIGTTAVHCVARDSAGNVSDGGLEVTVLAARIAQAPDLAVNATSPNGAVVTYSVDAHRTYVTADLGALEIPRLGDAVPVTCTPPSGATFPIGTTLVTCTAADAAPMSFHIQVVQPPDTTPPVISVPGNLVVNATSSAGAVVAFQASATDAVDGAVPVTCSPASGSTFPLGTTSVTCTASDRAGNQAAAHFSVTVRYAFSGVLQPINSDGSSIFKLGSTVAVKFTIGPIATAIATLSLAKISNGVVGSVVEAVSTATADSGNQFRFDGSQYVFNLATRGLSTGTWQLRIALDDGTTYLALISLR
jgi:hypothetical protein